MARLNPWAFLNADRYISSAEHYCYFTLKDCLVNRKEISGTCLKHQASTISTLIRIHGSNFMPIPGGQIQQESEREGEQRSAPVWKNN